MQRKFGFHFFSSSLATSVHLAEGRSPEPKTRKGGAPWGGGWGWVCGPQAGGETRLIPFRLPAQAALFLWAEERTKAPFQSGGAPLTSSEVRHASRGIPVCRPPPSRCQRSLSFLCCQRSLSAWQPSPTLHGRSSNGQFFLVGGSSSICKTSICKRLLATASLSELLSGPTITTGGFRKARS